VTLITAICAFSYLLSK